MKDFLLKLWHKSLVPGLILAVASTWLLQSIWPTSQGIKRIFFLTIVWNIVLYGAVIGALAYYLV